MSLGDSDKARKDGMAWDYVSVRGPAGDLHRQINPAEAWFILKMRQFALGIGPQFRYSANASVPPEPSEAAIYNQTILAVCEIYGISPTQPGYEQRFAALSGDEITAIAAHLRVIPMPPASSDDFARFMMGSPYQGATSFAELGLPRSQAAAQQYGSFPFASQPQPAPPMPEPSVGDPLNARWAQAARHQGEQLFALGNDPRNTAWRPNSMQQIWSMRNLASDPASGSARLPNGLRNILNQYGVGIHEQNAAHTLKVMPDTRMQWLVYELKQLSDTYYWQTGTLQRDSTSQKEPTQQVRQTFHGSRT